MDFTVVQYPVLVAQSLAWRAFSTAQGGIAQLGAFFAPLAANRTTTRVTVSLNRFMAAVFIAAISPSIRSWGHGWRSRWWVWVELKRIDGSVRRILTDEVLGRRLYFAGWVTVIAHEHATLGDARTLQVVGGHVAHTRNAAEVPPFAGVDLRADHGLEIVHHPVAEGRGVHSWAASVAHPVLQFPKGHDAAIFSWRLAE